MPRMQLSKKQVSAISCLLTILLLIPCILFCIGLNTRHASTTSDPFLIVAAISTFLASICSFLLTVNYYRLVVIVFVPTHSFAVIFAWIGIGLFVNPFLGSPERVGSYLHTRQSFILNVVASVLLTALLPLIIICFCFAGIDNTSDRSHTQVYIYIIFTLIDNTRRSAGI